MNHVFEEGPAFHTEQILPELINAAHSKSHHNLYAQAYNLGWKNHLISHEDKTTTTTQGQTISPTFNLPIINTLFPNQHSFSSQAPQSLFQNPLAEKKLTNLEKIMTSFMQNMRQLLSNNS